MWIFSTQRTQTKNFRQAMSFVGEASTDFGKLNPVSFCPTPALYVFPQQKINPCAVVTYLHTVYLKTPGLEIALRSSIKRCAFFPTGVMDNQGKRGYGLQTVKTVLVSQDDPSAFFRIVTEVLLASTEQWHR
jgi:hypothetical protein